MASWDLTGMQPKGYLKPAYAHIKSKLGDGLVGAAIGIAFGYGEEYVLDGLKLSRFFMVDPYIHFDFSAMTPELFEKQYVEARNKFAHLDNVIFLRETSEEASHNVPDGTLDFVYIDGNHFYPSVKKDIDLWFPKVRKGGVLGGHDYCNVPDSTNVDEHIHTWRVDNIHYGVVKAVNDFCKAKSYKVNSCKAESETVFDWWIDK